MIQWFGLLLPEINFPLRSKPFLPYVCSHIRSQIHAKQISSFSVLPLHITYDTGIWIISVFDVIVIGMPSSSFRKSLSLYETLEHSAPPGTHCSLKMCYSIKWKHKPSLTHNVGTVQTHPTSTWMLPSFRCLHIYHQYPQRDSTVETDHVFEFQHGRAHTQPIRCLKFQTVSYPH